MTKNFANDVEAADALAQAYKNLKAEIAKVIVGQDDVCSAAYAHGNFLS